MTRGGLLSGRATLLVGGPGSGKTVLALQTLINGALAGSPGIFVAFEENSRRIMANAASFGWDLPALESGKKIFFLDAQPKPDLVQAGSFDLSGMLAVLSEKARKLGARRIVFDSVDVLLDLLGNPQAERREIHRIHDWLLAREMSAMVTVKSFGSKADFPDRQPLGFMQFMVDCAIAMNHEIVEGVSQRSLRIIKYRGSQFTENETPFAIAENGIEVASSRERTAAAAAVTSERVSAGVDRLDAMLGGGYYRGASVLITGSPGTAKSTLCGTFAEAACRRGERTLLVSFDSEPAELVRNLASVNIQLGRHEKSKVLRLTAARTGSSSAEIHFMRIKKMAREHRARCLVIDPVSALSKQGNALTAHSVVERLTDWTKTEGITFLCTSLLEGSNPELESTSIQVSTIADTWIHLSYVVHSGERNRALTIIKSRGTAHSNQVREMILSDSGVTLTDVYSAGGRVLMGTLRWEKEEEERAEQVKRQADNQRRVAELQAAEAELANRMKALEEDLVAKRAERELLSRRESERRDNLDEHKSQVRKLRQADAKKQKKSRRRT